MLDSKRFPLRLIESDLVGNALALDCIASAINVSCRMGRLLIRNLDDAIIAKLRQRAAANGNSMEEEARQALAKAVDHDVQAWLADVTAFAKSLGPLSGPPSEVIIREMREERTRHLDELTRGSK